MAASFFLMKLLSCSWKNRKEEDDPFEVGGGLANSNYSYSYHVSSTLSSGGTAAAEETAVAVGLLSPTPALAAAHKGGGGGGAHLPIRPPAGDGGSGGLAALMTREFEHDVLSRATCRFHRSALLGEGAAGAAFRGTVLGHDGLQTPVAIKRFHAAVAKEDVDRVRGDLAGKPLRHRNLVYIIGYCLKNRKLYLVYDLMDNGNLEKHLFTTEGHPSLSWSRRFNIIKGIALGLQHLHKNGCIHGSVKANNVFLEEGDLTPRLGDFGYSRLGSSVATHNNDIRAVYRLPEAAECLIANCSAMLTREADVFYFGALVIEVVCDRRFIVRHGRAKHRRFLVDWVWSLHGAGHILDAVDATILATDDGGDLNRIQAERLLLVGLACSYRDPKQRLDMDNVVAILRSDRVLPLMVPAKKPSYVSPLHHHATMVA